MSLPLLRDSVEGWRLKAVQLHVCRLFPWEWPPVPHKWTKPHWRFLLLISSDWRVQPPPSLPLQSFISFSPGRCRMGEGGGGGLLWGPQPCWFYSKQWAAFLPETNLPPGKPHLREPEGGPEDVDGLKKLTCDWRNKEWQQEKKKLISSSAA